MPLNGGQVSAGDMVVMPHKSRMDLALLSREGFDMESFKFSKNRPGDDPGETYDVREYRPGDSTARSIGSCLENWTKL